MYQQDQRSQFVFTRYTGMYLYTQTMNSIQHFVISFSVTWIFIFRKVYKSQVYFPFKKYLIPYFLFVKCKRLSFESKPIDQLLQIFVHTNDELDTTFCDKFFSDLGHVSGFLRVLRFPPPIKLTATIYLKYCWKLITTYLLMVCIRPTIQFGFLFLGRSISHKFISRSRKHYAVVNP
jgi:hypothetical protein